MKPKSPCTSQCEDRSIEPNCHSCCDKYLDYQNELSNYREQLRKGVSAITVADKLRKDHNIRHSRCTNSVMRSPKKR